MRSMALVTLLIGLAVHSAGCKKKAEPSSTAVVAAGSDDVKPTVAKNDPWATPPPGASTLGAAVGDELSRIAKTETTATLKRNVALSDIAKVENDKLPMRGLAGVKATGFTVAYNPSTVPAHEEYRKALQGDHVFDKVAEGLNKTIRIPTTIDIQLVDCDTINAFYDPENKRIIVCYELVDYFLDIFRTTAKDDNELGTAVIGATIFAFFHESGHALIHILDLPAVGREEDSADQLATLTLIAAGDEGVSMALSGAYWFQLQQKSDNKTPFWDEHAFDGQRFYNVLCMIYGSNPEKYAGFVASGDLPKERAQRCPSEFGKISHAWQALLKPHLTSSGAQNMDITLPSAPSIATQPSDEPAAPSPGEPTPSAPTTTPGAPKDPWAQPTADEAHTDHAYSCQQVAEKAADLIGSELERRAAKMSAQEVADAKTKLDTELPGLLLEMRVQCERDDWPDKDRACVMKAKSFEAAERCDLK
jgi:hypothetical protein